MTLSQAKHPWPRSTPHPGHPDRPSSHLHTCFCDICSFFLSCLHSRIGHPRSRSLPPGLGNHVRIAYLGQPSGSTRLLSIPLGWMQRPLVS